MSYAVKRLEKEIDGELLIRLKNGVQLTHLGTLFLDKAHHLLREWEEIQKISNELDHVVGGQYRLGLHPSVALYTLDRFLPQLVEKYSNLEIKLIHGLSREITEQIVSWKVDFGIVVNPKPHPDLVIKELCRDQVAFFSKSNLREQAKKTLIYDENLFQSSAVIKKAKSRKHIFNKSITSENLEVIARLTSLGMGVGLLPERVAAQYKNLKIIKDSPIHIDRVCLVYRHEKQKNFSSKEIISFISNAHY